MYAKGGPREGQAFEIGYDGVDARSIRENDKAVVEKTPRDLADLAIFFGTQSAKSPIAWEVLADAPWPADISAVTIEKQLEVLGELCTVMRLPASPTNLDAPGGLRIYLAKDNLPRRIDRLQLPVDKETEQGARVLELTGFKFDDEATGGTYTLSVPSGYRVKAAESNKPKPTPKAEAPTSPGLIAVGEQAPEWELKDSEGKVHKLSESKGKVVLLDFWATWCGPCKVAMPSIQKLHEKYAGKLSVFGMNYAERGDPAAYMAKKGFTYTLLLDADDVAQDYKVNAIPCFYLIDGEGKVLYTAVGYSPAMEKALEAKIQAALAK